MKYFAGLLAVVALVAAATVGAYRLWDNTTRTSSSDNGGVLSTPSSTIPPGQPTPADNQVFVFGSVTAGHLENAVLDPLPMPVTVTTPQRGEGAGATIKGVTVGGKNSQIEWDAGRPFQLSGDGGALLVPTTVVDIADGAATVSLDGRSAGLQPGTYTLDTPVAVSTGGLARPTDSVTFDAAGGTALEFRSGSATGLPQTAHITGQGTVTFEGVLSVAHADRTIRAAKSITLDSGQYDLTIVSTPNGGFTLYATLTGTTH